MFCLLGPVTYRVVQVASQDGTETQPHVVTTGGLPTGAQVVVLLQVYYFHKSILYMYANILSIKLQFSAVPYQHISN